ncbi:MAG TPA: hypothetical protein VKN35_12235 [Xanthomonadales bacterium]|nr:hypothetical protein [Xanthomonadales bacterium]
MQAESRKEYLRGMGIDVWVLRGQQQEEEVSLPVGGGVILGPGGGDILLLCRDAAESASRIAADVARSLDCEPIWSWPAAGEEGHTLELEEAIEQRLITRVLVFGRGLHEPGQGSSEGFVGKARMIQTKSLNELAGDHSARKALWLALYENHWCAERARTS